MQRIGVVFLLTLTLLFFVKTSFAVTVSLADVPSSINDTEFSLTVTVDGAKPDTNYLRIDLYIDGSSNYFGETFNGFSWYGGGDGKLYFPIMISTEGSASAIVKGKIGDPTEGEYPGPGNYRIKIRRYTASGNVASGDDQISSNIDISWNRPQPTSSPEILPSPTSTPKPKPTSTPSPIVKASQNIIESSSPLFIGGENKPTILGETSVSTPTPTPSPKLVEHTTTSIQFKTIGGIFLVIGGLLFSVSAGFLLYKRTKTR
jgi:hypothetical protein